MSKVNPNKRNETNSEIFPWDIYKSDIFIGRKILTFSMIFVIGTFQFNCKSELN